MGDQDRKRKGKMTESEDDDWTSARVSTGTHGGEDGNTFTGASPGELALRIPGPGPGPENVPSPRSASPIINQPHGDAPEGAASFRHDVASSGAVADQLMHGNALGVGGSGSSRPGVDSGEETPQEEGGGIQHELLRAPLRLRGGAGSDDLTDKLREVVAEAEAADGLCALQHKNKGPAAIQQGDDDSTRARVSTGTHGGEDGNTSTAESAGELALSIPGPGPENPDQDAASPHSASPVVNLPHREPGFTTLLRGETSGAPQIRENPDHDVASSGAVADQDRPTGPLPGNALRIGGSALEAFDTMLSLGPVDTRLSLRPPAPPPGPNAAAHPVRFPRPQLQQLPHHAGANLPAPWVPGILGPPPVNLQPRANPPVDQMAWEAFELTIWCPGCLSYRAWTVLSFPQHVCICVACRSNGVVCQVCAATLPPGSYYV